MSRVADLIMLNIVFIICCIPIVTIGASVTAMHYVTLKMVRNEESYIIRGFFKSFKENFKQSTIIWLIMLAAGVLLVFDFIIIRQTGTEGFMKIIYYALFMILFVYTMVLTYIFPLLSKFENSIKNTFKNALFMSIRHLPWTILLIIVSFGPAIATLLISVVFVYGMLVWIMVGFALLAYINSFMFMKIFDHYMPSEEDEQIEADLDTDDEALQQSKIK